MKQSIKNELKDWVNAFKIMIQIYCVIYLISIAMGMGWNFANNFSGMRILEQTRHDAVMENLRKQRIKAWEKHLELNGCEAKNFKV